MARILLVAGVLLLTACHPENATARKLLESCDAGNAQACFDVGKRFQKGEYVLRDEARAATLYDRSCENGIGDGCATLGAMHLRASEASVRLERPTCDLVVMFSLGSPAP